MQDLYRGVGVNMKKELVIINPNFKLSDITTEELALIVSLLFYRWRELFNLVGSCADMAKRKTYVDEAKRIGGLINKIILDID